MSLTAKYKKDHNEANLRKEKAKYEQLEKMTKMLDEVYEQLIFLSDGQQNKDIKKFYHDFGGYLLTFRKIKNVIENGKDI